MKLHICNCFVFSFLVLLVLIFAKICFSAEQEYLIYNGNNFENVRISYNNLHNIPVPDGKKGFKNASLLVRRNSKI